MIMITHDDNDVYWETYILYHGIMAILLGGLKISFSFSFVSLYGHLRCGSPR